MPRTCGTIPTLTGPGTTAGTPSYRTSIRPDRQDVAPAGRAAVVERLGSTVVASRSATAGLTPGLATRLTLADGRELFLKGAGPAHEDWIARTYRREAATTAPLPQHSPVVPLLWTFESDGWFFAAYGAVDGTHPDRPWTQQDAERVLDAVTNLGDTLTPPPGCSPRRGSWVWSR